MLFQSLASHKRLSVQSRSINITILQQSTETGILLQYRYRLPSLILASSVASILLRVLGKVTKIYSKEREKGHT